MSSQIDSVNPVPIATPSPVALAEHLLALVKSIDGGTTERPAQTQTIHDAKHVIAETCDALMRSVLGPLEYTVLLAESCQESSALHFITSLGVPDVIGQDALSLAELSTKLNVQPRFLSIALSCLLPRGYFEEVGGFGSQVYRNNALSRVLQSDHPQTLKDAIGFVGDEGFKATSYLLEAAKQSHPKSDSESAQTLPAVNLAYGFKESVFEWMANPAHAWRGQRMGKAMQQLHRMANGGVITDFPWAELSSPVVDVGGGIGSLELALTKAGANGNVEFTIFDIPETIENAKKVWLSQPDAAQSQILFVPGNFLAPTLDDTKIPQGKPTYLIRHVLHDWTDDQVVSILKNVRAAMLARSDGSESATAPKLLLCEMLLRPTSSRFVRTTSMQLLALNNGVTRTEGEMRKLVEVAGFKVVKIHEMRAVDSIIEASPVV
ncbi:S-adenosyl-L-methionine-dependent methyltransferase [Cristinia sonorae]|uniref:S-adenosyl-L-methionine-dependent methyltransferase n=1 Tax=Cristinia sonorae TaxID=1940300 RepID=A0A8K0XK46_9AGAR|nr:S-adenosyl-L-methionine-dependent methyltransferase [Cristinia sonorae]